MMRHLVCAIVLAGRVAAAAPDDGYCDFVEGAADAQSATDLAPEIYSNLGYIEQADTSLPPTTSPGPRWIAGLRYRITGIYEGAKKRDRAHADCKRHDALSAIRGATEYRALEARAAILDPAVVEATAVLATDDAELAAQRTTTRETNATRLRVEELRQLATETHRQLAMLTAPSANMAGALAAYQRSDRDVEEAEGKLRRAQAFEVSVRIGLDTYLDRDTPTPYFAVLGISVNLGTLFQGSSNTRAAAGRERFVRSGHDVTGDASIGRLQSLVEVETKRELETATLVDDLQHQVDQLAKLGGEDAKRYRQTVWFELVKARAEHGYLVAHLASLHEVLGT